MKQIALVLAAPLALAACIAEVPGAMPAEDQCGAAALQSLVGQPQSVINGMTFPDGTRIILPGMAVTMDYRPDRLNIQIGEDGLVESVHCV